MERPRPELDGVECPACGRQPFRAWARQGRWRAVRCASCGLGITWPRPEAAALEGVYDADYYEARGMGAEADSAWSQRAGEILANAPTRPGRVLDFGAGQGHLVAALRRLGLAAEGFEPSALGRAAARNRYGIDLHADLSALAPASFDLITLVHSLEHVPDPLVALCAVAERLRAGGHVFVEVPHAGSVEMWRPSRRRHILDLPAHLYHFVPATLAPLVRKAGLAVVRVRLTNPDALEWAFAVRARSRRATPAAPAAGAPANAPRAASAWAGRVLPSLRRMLPGWKFDLLATRAARASGPEGP